MKFNQISASLFAGLFLFSGIGKALALPAYPDLVEAAQPDGSEVMIRLSGDHRNHRALSADGYLLTADEEGFYVFADVNEEGKIVSTGIRNINLENRSATDNLIISRLDQNKIAKAFDVQMKIKNNKAATRGPGLASNHFPSIGNTRSLAILVEFQDKEFTIENPVEHYNRMMNEDNYSDNDCCGSARDYFVSNSGGLFNPYFDIYGPVKLPYEMAHYGGYEDELAYMMVVEACQILDDEIDFSQYDYNNDGYIDNVYIYYAGYGEADGGGYNTVWPHSWDLEYATYINYYFDDVKLNHYACSNELQKNKSKPDGIGSFLHEFSHVMGLPDLYCTDGSNAFTPGNWSIIDSGSYNFKSGFPPNYSSFERYALNWMEPELITEAGEYFLPPIDQSNKAFLVPTGREEEYFLIENRQFNNWDKYIPWHGMLVWHIDFDQEAWDWNTVNNNPAHQRVDLVEADDIQSEMSRVSDSFPGRSNITSFTSDTKPAFVSWANEPTGVNIYDIAEDEEGNITFRVELEQENSVTQITDASSVMLLGNRLVCKGDQANVYNLSGSKVAALSKGGAVTLPSGLYIISTPASSHKIKIK